MTRRERNHWAFCWWKALEFAGELPDWNWPRVYVWPEWCVDSGYDRASMWLDGAPIEALP